jgi:hypothetical protein
VTSTTTAEDRLAKLGIHLPDAPTPFGACAPAGQTGNLLFLSRMLATSGHTATVVGIVAKDLDVKAGREAAYTGALNVLALTKKRLGRSPLATAVSVTVNRCPLRTKKRCLTPQRPAPGRKSTAPGDRAGPLVAPAGR